MRCSDLPATDSKGTQSNTAVKEQPAFQADPTSICNPPQPERTKGLDYVGAVNNYGKAASVFDDHRGLFQDVVDAGLKLQAEHTTLLETFSIVQGEKDRLIDEGVRLEEEKSKLEIEHHACRQELDTLELDLAAKQRELDSTVQQLTASRDRVKDLQTQLEQSKRDAEEKRERIEEYLEQLDTIKKDAESVRRDHTATLEKVAQESKAAITNARDDAEKQVQKLRSELAAKQVEFNGAEQKHRAVKKTLVARSAEERVSKDAEIDCLRNVIRALIAPREQSERIEAAIDALQHSFRIADAAAIKVVVDDDAEKDCPRHAEITSKRTAEDAGFEEDDGSRRKKVRGSRPPWARRAGEQETHDLTDIQTTATETRRHSLADLVNTHPSSSAKPILLASSSAASAEATSDDVCSDDAVQSDITHSFRHDQQDEDLIPPPPPTPPPTSPPPSPSPQPAVQTSVPRQVAPHLSHLPTTNSRTLFCTPPPPPSGEDDVPPPPPLPEYEEPSLPPPPEEIERWQPKRVSFSSIVDSSSAPSAQARKFQSPPSRADTLSTEEGQTSSERAAASVTKNGATNDTSSKVVGPEVPSTTPPTRPQTQSQAQSQAKIQLRSQPQPHPKARNPLHQRQVQNKHQQLPTHSSQPPRRKGHDIYRPGQDNINHHHNYHTNNHRHNHPSYHPDDRRCSYNNGLRSDAHWREQQHRDPERSRLERAWWGRGS